LGLCRVRDSARSRNRHQGLRLSRRFLHGLSSVQ